MVRRAARAAAALVLGFGATIAFARNGEVAITFDDLPLFGLYAPPGEAERITGRLLTAFKRHHWPATGFVNEIQLEGPNRAERAALLSRWLDAGLDLGKQDHLHPVTLDRAMTDPAYGIPDNYVGPDGDEWLTRWSLTLHKTLPYAQLPIVSADVAELDAKFEAGPAAPAAIPAAVSGTN